MRQTTPFSDGPLTVLAFSSVPVLNALGRTVAPGTLLALLLAAALAPRELLAPAGAAGAAGGPGGHGEAAAAGAPSP